MKDKQNRRSTTHNNGKRDMINNAPDDEQFGALIRLKLLKVRYAARSDKKRRE